MRTSARQRERRKHILLAYLVGTGGRLPVPPELLRALQEVIPKPDRGRACSCACLVDPPEQARP